MARLSRARTTRFTAGERAEFASTWRTWLPSTFVIFSLVALLLVPVFLEGLFSIGLLTTLAAISAIIVASSARRFRRRAGEEQALRDAALTLTEAVDVGEVLRRIALAAADVDRGSSAYVERIVADGREVEVVVTTGPPLPRVGTRAPYPGSLTAAGVESGVPEVFTDLAGRDRRMLEHLSAAVPSHSSAVAIPLIADFQPQGALVILRRPGRRLERGAGLDQVRIFGALAALALRKAVLLEQAEERHRALRQATEARARLLRGFSYDVKNPLGAADGHAALLEEGVLHDPERQRNAVRGIRRSIQSALDLINDLVELASADAGHLEIRPERTQLAGVLAAAAEDFRGAAEAAELELELAVPPDLPPVRTDPARVRQVLGNLLSNAIKYTPAGGRVRLEAAAQRVRRGRDPEDWVRLSVTDSGPGIPEDRRRLLFREFTRLDPGSKPGAGLGLAISQRIARLLGGQISVASPVGAGSTFTLWLPNTSRKQRVAGS